MSADKKQSAAKSEKMVKKAKSDEKSGKGAGGKAKKSDLGWELAPSGEVDRKSGKARLRSRFEKESVATLMKELGLKNRMQVPTISKIVVNMGLGEAISNAKILDGCVQQLAAITGQKPVVTRARKAISNFKLRAGQQIGAMVTLRNDRAWEFIDRLVNIALPRVRDFKGVSPKAFDGRGNYTLGLREQIIFPEINYDQVDKIKGLNVSIVTTAKNDEQGRALLKHLGMPFRA